MKNEKKLNVTELTDEELGSVVGGIRYTGGFLPDPYDGTDGWKLTLLDDKIISAVNDTNTEVDRESIQKEIDASFQQIDDNALTAFNGKPLNTH